MEELQEVLKNNGVEMTMDEVQKMLRELAPQDELSEDDLDAVAGGIDYARFVMFVARIIGGMVVYIKRYLQNKNVWR